ncbi:hypothetical protein [Rickettsia endosymbiont of Cantharis rufa]|uniref:hypothetical protein n=1 Tax=Rickettsia endosymbiont of Cantharis rufa TaxID=3066248 RepID=UPI003132BEAC
MNSKIVYKQLLVLNTKIRFFRKITAKDHLNALDQIAEFGTPYDVRYIIHHIFFDNHKISRKAASVIRKLLIKPEIMKIWPNLYASFSYYYGYESDNLWSKEKLQSFTNFAPEEAAHLYGVASLNYSGYIREEALNYLKNFLLMKYYHIFFFV